MKKIVGGLALCQAMFVCNSNCTFGMKPIPVENIVHSSVKTEQLSKKKLKELFDDICRNLTGEFTKNVNGCPYLVAGLMDFSQLPFTQRKIIGQLEQYKNRGGNLNEQAKVTGNTFLHFAVTNRADFVVSWLLMNGANPDQENHKKIKAINGAYAGNNGNFFSGSRSDWKDVAEVVTIQNVMLRYQLDELLQERLLLSQQLNVGQKNVTQDYMLKEQLAESQKREALLRQQLKNATLKSKESQSNEQLTKQIEEQRQKILELSRCIEDMERKQREEAERVAKEEAEKKRQEEERLAKEAEEKRQREEAERAIREAIERQKEEEARVAEKKRLEEERKQKKKEANQKKKEKKAEKKQQAITKAIREEEKRKEREEAERVAREEAEKKKQEEKRLAKEAEEKRQREEAERVAREEENMWQDLQLEVAAKKQQKEAEEKKRQEEADKQRQKEEERQETYDDIMKKFKEKVIDPNEDNVDIDGFVAYLFNKLNDDVEAVFAFLTQNRNYFIMEENGSISRCELAFDEDVFTRFLFRKINALKSGDDKGISDKVYKFICENLTVTPNVYQVVNYSGLIFNALIRNCSEETLDLLNELLRGKEKDVVSKKLDKLICVDNFKQVIPSLKNDEFVKWTISKYGDRFVSKLVSRDVLFSLVVNQKRDIFSYIVNNMSEDVFNRDLRNQTPFATYLKTHIQDPMALLSMKITHAGFFEIALDHKYAIKEISRLKTDVFNKIFDNVIRVGENVDQVFGSIRNTLRKNCDESRHDKIDEELVRLLIIEDNNENKVVHDNAIMNALIQYVKFESARPGIENLFVTLCKCPNLKKALLFCDSYGRTPLEVSFSEFTTSFINHDPLPKVFNALCDGFEKEELLNMIKRKYVQNSDSFIKTLAIFNLADMFPEYLRAIEASNLLARLEIDMFGFLNLKDVDGKSIRDYVSTIKENEERQSKEETIIELLEKKSIEGKSLDL